MSSLISDSDKASLNADFSSLVETYIRPLTIYQEATQTVIVSDPNYNPYEAYNQNNTNILSTPNPVTISGRILYDNQQEWSYLSSRKGLEGQIKQKDQTKQSVRLKVDASGYSLLANMKQAQIDGALFALESVVRPHGLFDPNYYTFFFVRSM